MSLPRNHIYQYSLVNALMAGVSGGGIQVSSLLSKGTQGLGTFVLMNGEMLLLDGKCYQLLPEGRIREAAGDDECPYACVTNFQAEHAWRKLQLKDKEAVDRTLSDWGKDARNLFVSYRITGTFKRVKCRTVKGQEYEGQPLSELGKSQFEEEYADTEGTIIGFRAPAMWQGFFVAGEHMHFVDRDRRRGGHVLELESGTEGVTMEVAVVADLHVELPRSSKFNEADMKTDDIGVKAVEG